MASPVKIFCCYAHKDQSFLNDLKSHLCSLQRQELITLWADTDINAGLEREKEIEKHLNTAQIILLLVSPDFIASEYCYSKVKRAMERYEGGEARVIPIILRPVRFENVPFRKLQALPKDAKPVTSWSNTDEAFLCIEEGIYKVVNELIREEMLAQVVKRPNLPSSSRRDRKRILVVDDAISIQFVLRTILLANGYEVLVASRGKEALEMVQLHEPDLILLDLCLPRDSDGLDVCKQVRQFMPTVPIIIISALEEEKQKVRALDIGADDYITKPFGSDELQARVRAWLRRSMMVAAIQEHEPGILSTTDGYVRMDLRRHQVHVGNQEVQLTSTEFALLRQLMLYAGKVLTHRSLLRTIWGPDYIEEVDYLRIYVRQLRRKVEIEPSRPCYIQAEPGVGYVFRSNVYVE